MDAVDKAWLEELLVKHSEDCRIVKLLSVKCEEAVGKQEHYASIMKRARAVVQYASGRTACKSFIIKSHIDQTELIHGEKLQEIHEFSNTEALFYDKFIPIYEQLLDEEGLKCDRMWALCYGTTKTSIFLEDLKERGFRLANRKAGLDLNHAKLLLMNLGRLHGLGAVAVKRGLLRVEEIPKYSFTNNSGIVSEFVMSGFRSMSKAMKNHWAPEWSSVADKLLDLSETILNSLKRLEDGPQDTIKVVCHGDSWTNNFMFKYLPDMETPTQVIFLDFQITHYGYYAWDIVYFLYSSLLYDTRVKHLDELLDTYCNSLSQTLDKLNFNEVKRPTREEAKREVQRLGLFAFLCACLIQSIVFNESSEVEIDDLLNQESEAATSLYTNSVFMENFMKNYADFKKMNII